MEMLEQAGLTSVLWGQESQATMKTSVSLGGRICHLSWRLAILNLLRG
jgi:hypothetical protein